MTLPHMLGAAAEYRTVDGLHPDPKKHLIFADIEPVCSFFSLKWICKLNSSMIELRILVKSTFYNIYLSRILDTQFEVQKESNLTCFSRKLIKLMSQKN